MRITKPTWCVLFVLWLAVSAFGVATEATIPSADKTDAALAAIGE